MGIPSSAPSRPDSVVAWRLGAGASRGGENYWREKKREWRAEGRGGVGIGEAGRRRLLLRDPAADAEPRRMGAGRGICSAHTHARHGHTPCVCDLCGGGGLDGDIASSELVMNRTVSQGRDAISSSLALYHVSVS
jgi:hypothetical protein